MIRNLSTILVVAAVAITSCQKEKEAKSPVDDAPNPPPIKVITEDVSIASVSIAEDCPDAKPGSEAERASSGRAAEAKVQVEEGEQAPEGESAVEGDMAYGYAPPCRQSFMQIAIKGEGDDKVKFAVTGVRVLDAAGTRLGTVRTRMPTIWKSEGYLPWNEVVRPSDGVKASYKISLPIWDDASKGQGQAIYGQTYMLEADVLINGVSGTIRSSPVVPEPPEMVET